MLVSFKTSTPVKVMSLTYYNDIIYNYNYNKYDIIVFQIIGKKSCLVEPGLPRSKEPGKNPRNRCLSPGNNPSDQIVQVVESEEVKAASECMDDDEFGFGKIIS